VLINENKGGKDLKFGYTIIVNFYINFYYCSRQLSNMH